MVPTSCWVNAWALPIRTANLPKARKRTIASSWSRYTTGSLVPHLRSVKVLVETNTTAAWNGLLPPQGMPISLVSSGRFWVARVWRPGPKVSRALPSRSKTACWLSSTISWLPSWISAVPERGQRATMVLPCGSWCWMTCMRSLLLGAGLDHGADHVLPPRPLVLDTLNAGDRRLHRRGRIAGAGRRDRRDVAADRLDRLEEREIELVEALQLGVADLHHVEQAGGAVVGEANRLRHTVELAIQPVEGGQRADLGGVGVGARLGPRHALGALQLLGQVLALQLVDVAPQLAVLKAAVARDPGAQPFQPVALLLRFLEAVGHE